MVETKPTTLHELKKEKIFVIFEDDEYILFTLNGEQYQQYKNTGITQKIVKIDGKESWEEVIHIHIDKYHVMEEVNFPKTGKANKSGVQLLFEDDEVKIMRLPGNRLIRCWKNKPLTEYAFIDENERNPEYVEWKKALDLSGYKSIGDSLIHPDTGHKITSEQFGNMIGSKDTALRLIKDWSVEVENSQMAVGG